jgi:hypothetical protein
MFTKRLFIPFVTIALLSLIVIRGIGLAALPNTEASGNFATTSTTIHRITDDKFNEVIDVSSMVTYTGTLEGTSIVEGTFVVHRDGSANFKGVETFTGSVNGMPGTLTFELAGSNDLYQEIQLTNRIISGTGELAPLQGGLSKTGIIKDTGPVGTYTGQINTTSNPNVEVEESDEY